MTNSHQQRVFVISELVKACHDNNWTYDSSGLADKISLIATRMGFNKNTVKQLVYSVVTILKMERDAKVVEQVLQIRKAEA